MLAEVHNPITPASPYRALIAAALLLLFASALAAGMTWRRSGEPLSPRVYPPDWTISFEAPEGWSRGLRARRGSTAVITFHGSNGSGHSATLAFWRLDPEFEEDPEAIIELILGQHGAPLVSDPHVANVRSPATKLGQMDASERVDARQRTVVRAALISAGDAYAVSLSVDGDAIDEYVYRLFDLACLSVRYEAP